MTVNPKCLKRQFSLISQMIMGEEEHDPLLPERDPARQFQALTKGYQAELFSPAQPPLTGYSALDACLSEIGEGTFHYRLLALLSFGNFVEAVEISLNGLLLPLLAIEFETQTQSELAIIGSLTGFGMMIGVGVFALFSNRFGRRLSFQISLFVCTLFGFLSSFSTSLESFAWTRFGLGIGYGGNLVASTTLLAEFTSSQIRAKYFNVTNLSFGIGAVFVISLAWGLIPIIGFRWFLRLTSFLAIPVLCMLPFCPESPRFLLMRERVDDTRAVLLRMAEMNRVPEPPSLSLLSAPSSHSHHPTAASRWCLTWKTTLPLTLVWFVHSFATGIYSFLPLVLSMENEEDGFLGYKIAFCFSVGSLVGTVILFGLTDRFGRLTLMRFGLFFTGILTALLGVPVDSSAYVFCMVFFLSMISLFPVAMLYLYTPEVHPTETRTIGFGICMLGHRLAPVMSPFVVAVLGDTSNFTVTALVFGSLFWVAGLLSLALRVETLGRKLLESHDHIQVESTSTQEEEEDKNLRALLSKTL